MAEPSEKPSHTNSLLLYLIRNWTLQRQWSLPLPKTSLGYPPSLIFREKSWWRSLSSTVWTPRIETMPRCLGFLSLDNVIRAGDLTKWEWFTLRKGFIPLNGGSNWHTLLLADTDLPCIWPVIPAPNFFLVIPHEWPATKHWCVPKGVVGNKNVSFQSPAL